MKILIYGFGRMGLTHYAILNNILDNVQFTFVDPNKVLNLISKRNIKGKFLTSDEGLNEAFDLTLITTPPFIHKELVNNCVTRGDKLIFVEKPFGGHSNFEFGNKNSNVYVGYVLRFNPVVQWVKANINPSDINECYSEYLSNTIENKPKGWRNGRYSGVLNEMGSHILDLNNFLFNLEQFKIKDKSIKSHISDVDDEVKLTLDSGNRNFNFYFNWVDKSIRKPMFYVKLNLKDGSEIRFDQQKIEIKKGGELKTISVVELEQDIPFYLRGVDFTKQMMDLINKGETLCTVENALVVNKIMNKTLEE